MSRSLLLLLLIHFERIGWRLGDISWQERPSLESAHIDTCGRTFDGQSDYWDIFGCKEICIICTHKDYVGGGTANMLRNATKCFSAHSLKQSQYNGPRMMMELRRFEWCQLGEDTCRILCEGIKWSNIAERKRVRQEEDKERSILENKLKKRQEW
ncbi:hypothetical protein EJB05_48261, partial [Eragrostis curvula]